MAAPLPSGFGISALPQAPQVDTRAFVRDPAKEMAIMKAGLDLGGEMARLGDLQAQIELERKQRKAESAATELKAAQAAHALENLPKVVQAQMAEVAARQAAQQNALAQEQALAAAQVPQTSAQLAAQQASNALAGAKADAVPGGFAYKTTPQRTQLLAASQALGGMAIPEGGMENAPDGVPLPFRTQEIRSEIDKTTGNTIEKVYTIDKRNGNVIGEPKALGTTKLGVDEKSVASMQKDAIALIQTRDLADTLRKSLDTYAASGKGGLGQAVATNVANSAPTGMVSVVKKALAAKAQSPETIKIAGDITNLKNTIANSLFGAALTKEESANLQGMLPTAEDIADPARAREKLDTTIRFIESKLAPIERSGALGKMKITGTPAASAPTSAAPPPTAADFSDAPIGTIREIGGVKRQMTIRDGVKGWALVK